MKGLYRHLTGRIGQDVQLSDFDRIVWREMRRSRLLTRLRRTLRPRPAWHTQVFSDMHDTNAWRDPESKSGPGSSLAYTESIRRAIPGLVDRLGVRQVLDAPCGDFNWFRHVTLPAGVRYLGADVVPALVATNQARYGAPHRAFLRLDIVKDPLPAADLWLCRDVLFHFSEHDIARAIGNFLRSPIPYLLTSSHTAVTPGMEHNRDVPTGSFRLLNLRLPPFGFPEPLAMIDDWIEGYPERSLCLWHRDALIEAVTARVRRALRTARTGGADVARP